MNCQQCGKVKLTSKNRRHRLINVVHHFRDPETKEVKRTMVTPTWLLICSTCDDAITEAVKNAEKKE